VETCRNCRRRRDCQTAQRFGGGNYRRPPRYTWANICDECKARLWAEVQERNKDGRNHGDFIAGDDGGRWVVSSLEPPEERQRRHEAALRRRQEERAWQT
jgi:uncharacterized protein YlaI